MATTGPRRPTLRVHHQRYSWRQDLRANLYDRLPLFGESLVALALLLLIILVDILTLLRVSPDKDFGSALVDALSLLALQAPPSVAGQPAGRFLLAFNILFSLLFAQSVLNSARALFRKRDLQAQQLGLAVALNDHVIVCGLGRVGLRVATRLVAAGFKVAVIEQNWNAELVPRALELRVPVIVGDAREPRILRQAGLMRACAVIASIDGDLIDVEIALAARAERPQTRVVLRAFNEEFDRGLERSFGLNSAFSASALAAPTFAAATVSRFIEHVLPIDGQLLGVTDFIVPSQQSQPGPALSTVRALEEQYAVRVLRQPRSSSAQRPLAGGERLTLIGSLAALESLQSLNRSGSAAVGAPPPPLLHPTGQFDTVVICGLGKIGYRVVLLLHAMRPRPRIVVLHRDDDHADDHASFSQRISQLEGVTSILGDARDADVLAHADLDRAFAVAAVTSDDLTNLRIGLEARRMRPDVHVVLRVFSDNLAEKLVDLFGIHTAYSTSDLASPTLAAAAVLGGVSHAFFTDSQLYAMDMLTASSGDALVGRSVEALRKQYDLLIVGLERAGVMQALPPHEMLIAPGDTLSVVARAETLAKLRKSILAHK